MKNLKNIFLVFVVAMLLLIFTGCGNKNESKVATSTTEVENSEKTESEKTVALIPAGDENFWDIIKKGGEKAAKEFGYEIKFYKYSKSADEFQENAVKKAVSEGVSSLVIAPIHEEIYKALAVAYDKKIPVVQFLTEYTPEDKYENIKNPVISTVLSDNEVAGALCAEELINKVKEDIKKTKDVYTVGIIISEDNPEKKKVAEEFAEKFKEIANADEDLKDKFFVIIKSDDDFTEAFEDLYKNKVKAIFMTEEKIGNVISDYVSADIDKYTDIVFCGFDSGAKQIKWLKSGGKPEFIGGVAQKYFDLGYNAVRESIMYLEGGEVKSEVNIAVEWYDKENADKLLQDEILYN